MLLLLQMAVGQGNYAESVPCPLGSHRINGAVRLSVPGSINPVVPMDSAGGGLKISSSCLLATHRSGRARGSVAVFHPGVSLKNGQ